MYLLWKERLEETVSVGAYMCAQCFDGGALFNNQIMEKQMETAILLFKQYSGQGMIVTLFLIALGYLWFEEKNKEKRRLLIGLPVCILFMFFCPLVVIFLEKLSEEDVFWRMLWSIPMLIIIAYAAVLLIRNTEGVKRYLAIAGLLAVIVISGDYLYNNSGFLVAENPEHIPADVVEICDEIIVEGREVKACFPSEMLMYVTQYTAYIQMPYGREMFLKPDGITMWNRLYEIMESEKINAEELAEELRMQRCHFVVLRKTAKLSGNLEKEEWKKYYESEGYVVYLDEKNDPRFW